MTYNPPPASDPFNQPPSDPYGQSGAGAPNPYAQQPISPPPPPPPAAPQYGQPYGQPQPQYGYPQPPTAKSNGMAIASMVLGIVGVLLCWCYGIGALPGLVGAILGHISLKQIRERNEGGRGMALTGIITGWLSVLLVIIGIIFVVIMLANDPNFMDQLNN